MTVVAGKVRMLTHRDAVTADVEEAVRIWSMVANEIRKAP